MAATHPGKYLLLIDDDFTTRELTSHILAADGFRVAVARNGADALERLRGTERPDLILLDLNMPVMDGEAFVLAYRASTAHPAPILVLTAGRNVDQSARALGVEGSMSKPFDLAPLFALVERLMDERREAT